MKLGKDVFEWAYVALFLIALGYIGMGATLNHELSHPYPYGLSASDAYGDVAFINGVIDLGSYKVIPGYIRAGFDDTVGFHMPIFYHLVAMFSLTSGIPVWDAAIVISMFFSLIAVLMMYILIREYSKHVALLSLPLTVFLYVGTFQTIYNWGVWDLVVANAFLIASVFALSKLEEQNMWIVLGVLSAAIALAHITEAFFFVLFAMVYLAVKIIKRSLSVAYIKKLAGSAMLSLGISV